MVLAAAAVSAAPALAQQVLHAPDAIRVCICDQAMMQDLAQSMADRRRAHDTAQSDLNALDRQVEAARQRLDPDDAAARDAYADLLARRDAAQQRLVQATPPLNDAVGRYNAAADAFNGNCAGKAYDPQVLASVQATPDCPTEPEPTALRP